MTERVRKFSEMSVDEREAYIVFRRYTEVNYIGVQGLKNLTRDYGLDYELFKAWADKNGDSMISFPEFQEIWAKCKNTNFAQFDKDKVENLKNWLAYFDSIDKNHDGILSLDELKTFCKSVGMNVSEAQLKTLDKDGSGSIDFEEFLIWNKQM
jgi:hypothetical protein